LILSLELFNAALLRFPGSNVLATLKRLPSSLIELLLPRVEVARPNPVLLAQLTDLRIRRKSFLYDLELLLGLELPVLPLHSLFHRRVLLSPFDEPSNFSSLRKSEYQKSATASRSLG
jgi:hypothetical protein